MSYGGYQQYGGNPYESSGQTGGYGAQNPYGSSTEYNQDVERYGGAGANDPYFAGSAQAHNQTTTQGGYGGNVSS
jgi:syntaxin 1B/2/3